MVYIYNENGEIKFTRGECPTGEVIVLERMIPRPVRQGYDAILHADFETKEVWYNLVPFPPTLDEVKRNKIVCIQTYDTSDKVNSFTLSETKMWLDKSTRVGLMNSIGIEKQAGKTETTLWFNAVRYDIPIPLAIQMLNALELYALECYNVTQGHIASVNALQTMKEVNEYDYTSGYPEKLMFNLTN